MIAYGMLKVFPLQMPPISLGILNQSAGQMTPHTLLWSLVALYPLYEFICGAAEVTAGTMVLFRRTALAGTLLSIFVMSNVVLYNFFFGVSVKLFSFNLLLAEIFLVLPGREADVRLFLEAPTRGANGRMDAAFNAAWRTPICAHAGDCVSCGVPVDQSPVRWRRLVSSAGRGAHSVAPAGRVAPRFHASPRRGLSSSTRSPRPRSISTTWSAP